MAAELFTADWARALAEEINASDAFRRAGARWSDSVVFVMQGDGVPNGDRAVLVDLRGGRCEGCRPAKAADRANASFVITADPATWRELLDGRTDLVMAVMRGRFSLERGTLPALLPHISAARELLRAAARVTG